MDEATCVRYFVKNTELDNLKMNSIFLNQSLFSRNETDEFHYLYLAGSKFLNHLNIHNPVRPG